MPHYDISIYQAIGLEEVDEGQEYTHVQEAWWSGQLSRDGRGECPSGLAGEVRRRSAPRCEVKITSGPLVCRRCGGRGKLTRDAPGIDPGPDWPVGSSKQRTCPECNGTGNITQRP